MPQSTMVGKTKDDKLIKKRILERHSLEGVITLNKNTFYGVGTNPCIAVFTAHEAHKANKRCRFVNFEDDGFAVSKHIGLVKTTRAISQKVKLLNCWRDMEDAESKFLVKTTIEPDDEWLHSFYYFNDEIPVEADFEKTVGDHLGFEFSMIMQNRNYLFEGESKQAIDCEAVVTPSKKKWMEFGVKEVFFETQRGKRLKKDDHEIGETPYISASGINNGVDGFIGNTKKVRFFEDCLTVANSGSVGATFYQPFRFVASDHVTMLSNEKFSKYVYLFISTAVRRLGQKYSFNREINDRRLVREKILLPINAKGEPDYVYMENYIKKLEFDKLNVYAHKKQLPLS